jgi:2-oxoglutarate ferredoxin oxidoreductase subunit gamma
MTQEACDKYTHDLKEGGILLVDSDLVTKLPTKGNFKIVSFPIINTAKTDVGREIVANIVALGAMVALTGQVSRENAEKAVLSSVPEAFIELNRKAFSIGFEKALAASA